jgi:hypothetical protein
MVDWHLLALCVDARCHGLKILDGFEEGEDLWEGEDALWLVDEGRASPRRARRPSTWTTAPRSES